MADRDGRRGWAVLAVGLILVAALAFWPTPAEPETPAQGRELPVTAREPTPLASRGVGVDPRTHDAKREQAVPSRVFRVVDPDGRAVAGARLHVWAEAGIRGAAEGARVAFATTDPAGECRIEEGAIGSADWERVCATATSPGFGHAWLDSISTGPNLLQLRSATELRVRCVLRSGRPLADAILALSLSQPDRADPLQSGLPVGPAAASVHTATTDDDGLCTIPGLLSSSYILAVEHDWAMLTTRLENGYYVRVGDGGYGDARELELVFDEPLVVAFALSAAPAIRWFVTPSARMPAPHPGAGQYEGLVRRLRRAARERGLESSFYSYVVTRSEQAIGKSVDVVYHAPGAGWSVTAVPFVPASRAELVILDPAAPVPAEERGMVIRLTGPGGAELPVGSLRLELVEFAATSKPPVELPRRSRSWRLDTSKRVVLPCGRYRLRPTRDTFGLKLESASEIELSPGASDLVVACRAAEQMRRVAIDALTPEGAVLEFFQVRIHRLDRPGTYHHTYSAARRQFYVPAGSYRFELLLAGFEPLTLERTLEGSSHGPLEETVVLTRAR